MKTETLSKSFPAFAVHTLPGDVREIQSGPFTIRATIHPDHDTTPSDFECYAPDHVKAWERGNWQFVGVVLSVWVEDMCLDDHAASLWGIECNFGTDNLHLTECADDLLPEALDMAEKAGRVLVEKLTEI
jgi:hypothetical protein